MCIFWFSHGVHGLKNCFQKRRFEVETTGKVLGLSDQPGNRSLPILNNSTVTRIKVLIYFNPIGVLL